MSFDQLRAAIRGMDGKVVAFESPTLLSILAELRHGDVSDQRLRTLQRAGSLFAGSKPTMMPTSRSGRFTAVIPVHGIATYDLEYQPYAFSNLNLARAVNQAAADPTIDSILLDIDSPGGYVTGTEESADAIYAARSRKPVVALVNPLAASAAYWIASQAGTIIGVPSADVGSIGVFMCHYDFSGALANAGIKPTFIFAGKHKTEGNPTEPLSADARAFLQSEVNKTFRSFVGAVARGRGITAGAVETSFGGGRVLGAKDALRIGMVDALAAPDAALQRVLSGNIPSRASAAAFYREQIAQLAQEPPSARHAEAERVRIRLAILGA
jgi:signal peptide peptidase SppA